MRRLVFLFVFVSATFLAANVSVSAPANGGKVATTVQYVASATTDCAAGISAIGIYSAPGNLAYSTAGSSLNTLLTFSPGEYQTVVQAWDNCGGVSQTPVAIQVSAPSTQVQVTAPKNNAAVASQVQYVANSTTSCLKGVAAMGIYTSSGMLAYHSAGASLNAVLTLNPGTYHSVVQEWDNCGGSAYTPVTIQVSGASSGGGQVTVSEPQVNSAVSPTVQYVASATSSCPAGIASMGIYTAPGVLAYTSQGAQLNTLLNLNPGTYHTVVQEWDNCGGSSVAPVAITVGGSTASSSGGGVFTNLHQQPGWQGYALLPPLYDICSNCVPSGPQTTWSMTQNIASPSLSGNSTQMSIGGQTVYSDVLWNNHLIGDFSSQGLPDTNHTLAPNLHNFTYDVYFYANNLGASQALEFDINQFVNGQSFIWGHECRVAGGNEWDIWDDPGQTWHPTGIPCNPVPNAWNHLVLQVQRTSDNQLLFQSITLNGVTATLNYYENPTSTTWYGITINYQQDGNYAETPYSIWLDKLNFTYW
jgi:hypothetical protein